MASGRSSAGKQKLAKAALAKSNRVVIDFGDINNTIISQLGSLSQSLGVTYDGNNNVSYNATNVDIDNLQAKANSVLVINVTVDTTMTLAGAVLVDCTSGDVVVTLPDPSTMFLNGRSSKVAITKVDSTSNRAIILPYSTESVLGEDSIELIANNEVVNLITDGTNWYLGA